MCDWVQVLTIIITIVVANMAVIIPLFLWSRAEANTDQRELRNLIDEMKNEMKDFHARMCVLEERYLQILTQRLPKSKP